MGEIVLIDFGSTFTKGVMIDLGSEEIIAQSNVPSTVDQDVRLGLAELMVDLKGQTSPHTIENAFKLACSSAAGGLRIVVIGLVTELTVEAGRKAACNAGAKVIDSFAGVMDDHNLIRLAALTPDLILLSGGTDGGNRDVVISNAELLAEAKIGVPVIIAGNKNAAKVCRRVLEKSGQDVFVTENVMPNINSLNIEPVRETIREVFINRIAKAKGIDKVQGHVSLLMPTPNAVFKAVSVMAQGTAAEEGLGDLLVVDIGGATTDVYSAGDGMPTMPNVTLKGLPEPSIKRTVEGDLGVRHNAVSILEMVGAAQLLRYAGLSSHDGKRVLDYCYHYHLHPTQLPQDAWETKIDTGLAKAALSLGVERHVGSLELAYIPGAGETYIQTGKDLRELKTIIGTGGPLIFAENPLAILSEALFSPNKPTLLKPAHPRFMLDKKYILYALGLLSVEYPVHALRLAKKYLFSCDG